MLKAVLFDMDGVLIDSEPIHAKAFMESMKKYGVNLTLEYCYQFIGRTDRYMAEYLIEQNHLNATVEELLQEKNECIRKIVETNGYPAIPYVVNLVHDLYKHGISLAIASSSSMSSIQKTANDLNIADCFTKYVSGMDLKHSKPAPDIFLKSAALLSVKPQECLVIEDSENGVKAAKAAGMVCVGFVNPNSGNQDLSLADLLVEGFDEIDTKFLVQIYQRARNEAVSIVDTKHFLIRELTKEDIPALYHIYQTEGIREYVDELHGTLNEEIEKHEAYVENVYHFYGYGLWGVFDNKTNDLVGRCGIQDIVIDHCNEIEIGYCFDLKYQQKGYAYECCQAVIHYAFRTLEVPSLIACIQTDNNRSLTLAKRLGFVYEKTCIRNGSTCFVYRIQNM